MPGVETPTTEPFSATKAVNPRPPQSSVTATPPTPAWAGRRASGATVVAQARPPRSAGLDPACATYQTPSPAWANGAAEVTHMPPRASKVTFEA
jgi:hypothetical protein